MATTSYGTPYVVSADLVSGYPGTSLSLADRVDDISFKGNGINDQTGTTYTLDILDAGKTVTLSNASAVTVTIPTNTAEAIEVGSVIRLVNKGAGMVTIVPDATVTLNGGNIRISQNSAVQIVKLSTNTWGQVDNLGGLVLITNQSFSSAATINVNDCFSTNFVNYRVEVNGTCSTNVGYNFRLRVSGTDATTNYKNRAIQNDGTITTVNTATTYIELGIASSSGFATQFLVSRPFITETTMVSGQNAANDWGTFISGHHNAATSYTGFTMYLSTGNISGNVKVYGMKD